MTRRAEWHFTDGWDPSASGAAGRRRARSAADRSGDTGQDDREDEDADRGDNGQSFRPRGRDLRDRRGPVEHADQFRLCGHPLKPPLRGGSRRSPRRGSRPAPPGARRARRRRGGAHELRSDDEAASRLVPRTAPGALRGHRGRERRFDVGCHRPTTGRVDPVTRTVVRNGRAHRSSRWVRTVPTAG